MIRKLYNSLIYNWPRYILSIALAIPFLPSKQFIVDTNSEVGGPIVSDTTWELANSPFVVTSSIDVWDDVTLTIEPGVVVKFEDGKKLQVNGALIAQGTVDTPVIFTSNSTTPSPGDWGNIEFSSTSISTTMDLNGEFISGSVLKFCVVEYAQFEVESAIDTHSLLIDHCTIQNNSARGVYNLGTEDAPARVSNNIIRNNTLSIYSGSGAGGGINVEHGTINDNLVTNNSISYGSGGGIRAIYSIVTDNDVINNSAIGSATYSGGSAGGISISNGTASGNVVNGNSISGTNLTAVGGGIVAFNSVIDDNTVNGNYEVAYSGYGGVGIVGGESTIINNRVSQNTGSGIYVQGFNIVSGNTVDGNSSTKGGGIYAYDQSNQTVIKENIVTNNVAEEEGGGIYANSPNHTEVSGNIVISNTADLGGGIWASEIQIFDNIVSSNRARQGGGIYARESSVYTNTISFNSVSGSNARGAGVYLYNCENIFYNSVVGNYGIVNSTIGGIEIWGNPVLHYNNLYDNFPYDVTIISSDNISGTHNYWGTILSSDILSGVYDWYDDPGRGKLLFIPYLQELSIEAPLPPPTNLSLYFQGNSIVLSWNEHPGFTTSWGYKIYYDSDSTLPPFDGSGFTEGNSPIDAGNQTTFTINSVDPNSDYFFAVTVYDNFGNESWYSNMEMKQRELVIYIPLVLK